MLRKLFIIECKQTLKCLTYYVLVICMLLFYVAQSGEFSIGEKPQPGQEDYGFTHSEDKNDIMNNSVNTLVREYIRNIYITYPIGFYKEVTLSDAKQLKMIELITSVTNLSVEELKKMDEKYLSYEARFDDPVVITPSKGISYEYFLELMEQADKLLGGGSNYSDSFLLSSVQVPMTYEKALEEYNEILEKDHLSGAYARLFSDYMGIILAILPVFIAVTRGLRDRRARACEVIYSTRASSRVIVISRYLAMLVLILLPVILISLFPTIECLYYGASIGVTIDYLAFIKYIFGWLLPTIMITLSIGIVLTELTDSAIAILVQGLWWFISLFMGVKNIRGGYGWNLIPRHNTTGNYTFYRDNFDILVTNRIAYALLAVLLVMATIFIYELKRKGKLSTHGKIHKSRKSKSKV